MLRAQPAEIELASLSLHHFDALAQAPTLAAAVQQCLALLEASFSPRECQVVWSGETGPYLPGSQVAITPVLPSETERTWLEQGDLALHMDGDQPITCFAPLRARSELVGWLYLEAPHWEPESVGLLATIAAQAGPVLAFLEANNRYEKRVVQLQTLSEISRLLSGMLDLDRLLDTIYAATRRFIDVHNFYLALYNPTEDMLEIKYAVRDGERLDAPARWRPSQGLTSVMLAQQGPLCTDDYEAECARNGMTPVRLGELPIGKAWIGVPLFANDQFIGVMNVSSMRESYTYSHNDMDLLAAIGAQAAVAIENARLYQRSEHQARQLATLNRIGRTITSSLDPQQVPSLIMGQVCELLGVEEGSLMLSDEATGDLVFAYTSGPVGTQLLGQRLPRGVGLAGYVVSKGESVIVNDAQHDSRFYSDTDQSTGYVTRTLLAVPLRGVGGVQGVIEVLNRRNDAPFTSDDQRLLEAVADQAVIALENAKRFAQVDQALARRAQELAETNSMLQHNLRSLTALNALGMAINSSLRRPEEIFAMTVHGVVELTGAVAACVVLAEGDGLRRLTHVGPYIALDVLEGTARTVLRTGRPEAVQQDLEHGQVLLVVPLRATQRTLGALCVCFATELPSASDQETVVLFATQAAAASESIELFTAVRNARDEMASVLASTREGIMLISPNAQIIIANSALQGLCTILPEAISNRSVAQFLAAWQHAAHYPADEWAALKQGLDTVTTGNERFAQGELNATTTNDCSIEWAALSVNERGAVHRGALLVLRDITEAKEAERLRQDLTHMIVHDLRTPLTNVMASIDMLTKGISGEVNAVQESILKIAFDSSEKMLEMVNTLLDISRLEVGRMPLRLSRHAVAPLLDRSAKQLDSLARERHITLQQDIRPDVPEVWADADLITRVLQNLLANAVKFSGRASTVLVQVQLLATESTPALVRFAVRDRGVGIALKDQNKIFTKFGQVGERRGGTGLGLTFCKLVVEAHGGTIWVESTPGEGSSFFFTIPVATHQS